MAKAKVEVTHKFSINKKYYTGTVYEWNLPTGHTCPHALECLVKVDRETGKFTSDYSAYRCYASSAERFPSARKARWRNFDFVKAGGIPDIPKNAKAIRIHASGDFFSQTYFDMWLEVARRHPDVEFWAFTKSLSYWVNRKDVIPANLVLTASWGGDQDHLIDANGFKSALVVDPNDPKASDGSMPIDTNDDLARTKGVSFILIDNLKKKK